MKNKMNERISVMYDDLNMSFNGNDFLGNDDINKDFNVSHMDLRFLSDDKFDELANKLKTELKRRQNNA